MRRHRDTGSEVQIRGRDLGGQALRDHADARPLRAGLEQCPVDADQSRIGGGALQFHIEPELLIFAPEPAAFARWTDRAKPTSLRAYRFPDPRVRHWPQAFP